MLQEDETIKGQHVHVYDTSGVDANAHMGKEGTRTASATDNLCEAVCTPLNKVG